MVRKGMGADARYGCSRDGLITWRRRLGLKGHATFWMRQHGHAAAAAKAVMLLPMLGPSLDVSFCFDFCSCADSRGVPVVLEFCMCVCREPGVRGVGTNAGHVTHPRACAVVSVAWVPPRGLAWVLPRLLLLASGPTCNEYEYESPHLDGARGAMCTWVQGMSSL